MQCHVCGAAVVEGQKFCHDCGGTLRGVTDTTEQLEADDVGAATTPPAGDDAGPEPDADATIVIPADATVASGDASSASPAAGEHAPSTGDASWAPQAASGERAAAADEPVLPRLGELPTQEIDPREPLPDPTWAPGGSDVGDTGASRATAAVSSGEATLADLAAQDPAPSDAGGPISTNDFAVDPHTTDEVAVVGAATTVLPATSPAPINTDEIPVVFDGSDDVRHLPPAREPFKLRLMFVFGFFGAVATLMSSAADVTDIRTSTPVDGINTGITTLSDIGVNLPIAGYIGGAVMALGGLLACYGFRWGAGIAGGGGLAVAGWAGLTIGLAEVPIAVAESITRTTTTTQFTLTVTRDLGFWLIVASGAIGLLVFAASLRLAGTGGHRSLNPWLAAVGAVGALILAAGPLIPEGAASFSDNFRSPDALIDLPTLYFGGRLGQVALIAIAGVVGFLLVRAYGLGLVLGGVSVGAWMWASALLELEADPRAGDEPLGIAAGNFGAGDTIPHGVTTVGMVVTLTMLLIAAVVATWQYRRDTRVYR